MDTATLTDDEARAIRDRAEKATPGPWEWENFGSLGFVTEWTLKGPDVLCRFWYDKPPSPDALLIAHARTDITRLLSAREQDRKEIEALNAALSYAHQEMERLREKLPIERATAVSAERARCAEIARGATSYDDNVHRSAGCLTTGERIARAIEQGGEAK